MAVSKQQEIERLKRQIGERLRLARLSRNLRQIDVAIALREHGIKMNQSTIGKIERGERNLAVHELAVLLEVIEIRPDWVLSGDWLTTT